MLRRIPPVLLALGATVALLAVAVAVTLLIGAGQRRGPVCSAALKQGPYGCVVFVSASGSVAGRDAAEPGGGGITYRIERAGRRLQLVYSGDCDGGEGPVAVSGNRYRLGAMLSGQKACSGVDGSRDAWAARLFTGTVRVTERDDATVELVHGDRRAVFAEMAVPEG